MLDQILVILGITTLIMISPGPDMVIVMRNTIIGGRAAGLKSSLGVLAGNMVHITYCAIGVGILISQSILAFNILKYAGAAYLIYLGVMSFFASDTKLSVKDLGPRTVSQCWFLQGFLNNILNPKGTLFYLGVFTMVITPETATGTTLLLVAIIGPGVFAGIMAIALRSIGFMAKLLYEAIEEIENKDLAGELTERLAAWLQRHSG